MGAIGGLLGINGGANGSGFAAPTGTNIVSPVTSAQAGQAYTGAQGGLNAQQQLLQALQGQNGLGNQSSVYNQLQGVANGTGPNPALAQLNQATGQNVANQAALAAGQRGASSNVGLMARQAAQTGSNAQQQAAGQAATTQANQSLNALNSMGNVANTQAANQIGATQGLSSAQQAEQANLLNSISGVNNANVSMQGNINSNNTSLANQLTQGQQGLIGGMMQGASSAMSSLAGGGQVQRFDDGGGVEVQPIQSTPAPAPAGPPPSSNGGGSGGSGGGGLTSLIGLAAMMAPGGQVQRFDEGGQTQSTSPVPVSSQGVSPGPQSILGKFASSLGKGVSGQGGPSSTPYGSSGPSTGASALFQGMANLGKAAGQAFSGSGNGQQPQQVSGPQGSTDLPQAQQPTDGSMQAAKGGKVPVRLTPQEKVMSPKKAKEFANGGPMKANTVPGSPKNPGKNDYANDTYNTELKPGTIIIPLESLHTNEDARKFVQAVLAKKQEKK